MFDFVHSVKASFKLSQELWVACADYLSAIKRQPAYPELCGDDWI